MRTRWSWVLVCVAAGSLTACSIKKVTFFQDEQSDGAVADARADAQPDLGGEAGDALQETSGAGGKFGGAGGAGTGGAETGGAGAGGADATGAGGKAGDAGVDPGNDAATDQGAADLPGPVCGDGIRDPDEQCDYGPAVTESADCNHDCTQRVCGDGKVNRAAGEVCDDAGESPRCNMDCTTPRCGDGKVNSAAGETCDTLGGADTASCNGAGAGIVACRLTSCGDGYQNELAREACDDGNRINGDGCENDCTTSQP